MSVDAEKGALVYTHSCTVDLFRVKKSLSETKPDDVDLFTKNVQTFIKDVLANFKEYQLFCGTRHSLIFIPMILATLPTECI